MSRRLPVEREIKQQGLPLLTEADIRVDDEVIGRGAMGTVMKGHLMRDGTLVAVKYLFASHALSTELGASASATLTDQLSEENGPTFREAALLCKNA